VDVRAGSPTEGIHVRTLLGHGRSALVRIPPGVAHGCRNLGTAAARIIYFTDLHFSGEPDETDEGRLPWDFLGADVWDLARE
jgi:dTDP-4-dehydrorhamnose 3,5-epimerase